MRSVTMILLVCLGTLVMAQSDPEFGQVWQGLDGEPSATINPVPGAWNTEVAGSWHTWGRIMFDGEMYRMYASCWGPEPDGTLSIGLYTSSHLDSAWVEYENNPVFSPDPENWDSVYVANPMVMKDGEIYKMWYQGRSLADEYIWHIGYAESDDGITWTRRDSPVLSTDPAIAWESQTINDPFVLKENDTTYTMWYDGRTGTTEENRSIGSARSTDGINWVREESNPVLSPDASWCSSWVRYATVALLDDHYVMWFTGSTGTSYISTPFKMGTAISEDGVNWRHDKLYSPIVNSGPSGTWSEASISCLGVFEVDGIYCMVHSGVDNSMDSFSLRTIDYNPTIVPAGNASGTWTKAGSPYRVEGEINIPNGETLTIEAGTTIEFVNPAPLNVQGQILALGTEDDPIRFRVDDTLGFHDYTNTAGSWGGIRFMETPETNDSSLISYCDIEFGNSLAADTYTAGAVRVMGFNKLTVEYCLIQHNHAIKTTAGGYAMGGAMYINGAASPVILNNIFQYNFAEHLLENKYSNGGAIVLYDHAHPLISGNIFRYNQTDDTGGALSIWEFSDPTLINNLIVENLAMSDDGNLGYGGGIAIGWDAHPKLINNTIASNQAGWGGGGIYFNEGFATIMNTIIADNIWTNCGEGIEYGHDMAAYGNTMEGITVNVYHSNLEGGIDNIMWGPNNDGPPGTVHFIGSTGEDPSLTSSYHLSFSSQPMCGGIDSSEIDGEMYYAPDTDLNGNPRPSPAGTMPDKGCYEEILVDIDDIGSVPTGFQLYQNFPNPFNPLTSIRYTLPRPAEVNLVVYDILGQEVATLQSGFQTAGSYQTQWNGMDASGLGVSTGMYFCRLIAGDYAKTIKMVYLK